MTYTTAMGYGDIKTQKSAKIPARYELVVFPTEETFAVKILPLKPVPKKAREFGRKKDPIYLVPADDVSSLVSGLTESQTNIFEGEYFYRKWRWFVQIEAKGQPIEIQQFIPRGPLGFTEVESIHSIEPSIIYRFDSDIYVNKRDVGKTLLKATQPVALTVAAVLDLVTLPFQFLIAIAGD